MINSDATFTYRYKIDERHRLVQGHFPGFPVFPGVGQLAYLKSALEEHLNQNIRIVKLSRVKFLTLLKPPFDVELMCYLNQSKVRWELRHANVLAGSGLAEFETDREASI